MGDRRELIPLAVVYEELTTLAIGCAALVYVITKLPALLGPQTVFGLLVLFGGGVLLGAVLTLALLVGLLYWLTNPNKAWGNEVSKQRCGMTAEGTVGHLISNKLFRRTSAPGHLGASCGQLPHAPVPLLNLQHDGNYCGRVFTIPSSLWSHEDLLHEFPPKTDVPGAVATRWRARVEEGTLQLEPEGMETAGQVKIVLTGCSVEVVRDCMRATKSSWFKKAPLFLSRSKGEKPLWDQERGLYLFAEDGLSKHELYAALCWWCDGHSDSVMVRQMYTRFCEHLRRQSPPGLLTRRRRGMDSAEMQGSKAHGAAPSRRTWLRAFRGLRRTKTPRGSGPSRSSLSGSRHMQGTGDGSANVMTDSGTKAEPRAPSPPYPIMDPEEMERMWMMTPARRSPNNTRVAGGIHPTSKAEPRGHLVSDTAGPDSIDNEPQQGQKGRASMSNPPSTSGGGAGGGQDEEEGSESGAESDNEQESIADSQGCSGHPLQTRPEGNLPGLSSTHERPFQGLDDVVPSTEGMSSQGDVGIPAPGCECTPHLPGDGGAVGAKVPLEETSRDQTRDPKGVHGNHARCQDQDDPGDAVDSVVGTNLAFIRIGFDLLRSTQFQSWVLHLIQRKLDDIRRPAYLHRLVVNDVDLGNKVPLISGVRWTFSEGSDETTGLVPMLELDVQYEGDIQLMIETKVELQKMAMWQTMTQTLAQFRRGNDKTAQDSGQENEEEEGGLTQGTEACQSEGSGSKKGAGAAQPFPTSLPTPQKPVGGGRWLQHLVVGKAQQLMDSLADQVGRVTFQLCVRATGFEGQLRLWLTPAPCDRLWLSLSHAPRLRLTARPVLFNRLLRYSVMLTRVSSWVEQKIQRAVVHSMVFPSCVDIKVPWFSGLDSHHLLAKVLEVPQAGTTPPPRPSGTNITGDSEPFTGGQSRPAGPPSSPRGRDRSSVNSLPSPQGPSSSLSPLLPPAYPKPPRLSSRGLPVADKSPHSLGNRLFWKRNKKGQFANNRLSPEGFGRAVRAHSETPRRRRGRSPQAMSGKSPGSAGVATTLLDHLERYLAYSGEDEAPSDRSTASSPVPLRGHTRVPHEMEYVPLVPRTIGGKGRVLSAPALTVLESPQMVSGVYPLEVPQTCTTGVQDLPGLHLCSPPSTGRSSLGLRPPSPSTSTVWLQRRPSAASDMASQQSGSTEYPGRQGASSDNVGKDRAGAMVKLKALGAKVGGLIKGKRSKEDSLVGYLNQPSLAVAESHCLTESSPVAGPASSAAFTLPALPSRPRSALSRQSEP